MLLQYFALKGDDKEYSRFDEAMLVRGAGIKTGVFQRPDAADLKSEFRTGHHGPGSSIG
jgi:hypothetical protein